MNTHKSTPLRGRLFAYSPAYVIPLLIIGFSTLVFNLYDLDLAIQRLYFRDGWYLNDSSLIQAVYHYSNIPALVFSIVALFVFAHGYKAASHYRKYRKLSLFLVLTMILGPGLVVNSLLKNNWGRPRPRELVEFGGKYEYEAPLEIDPTSKGKSFPCGHASMGFYFFAPAMVFGIKRKIYGRAMFLFAITFGSLIGWIRVVQGGHFTSDVIFSGVLVFLSTQILFRIMNLHRQPLYLKEDKALKLKLWHKALIVVAGIALATGVGLATPYSVTQSYPVKDDFNYVIVDIQSASVLLSFADSTHLTNSASGFGFPGSKARLRKQPFADTLQIRQDIRGFFTEINPEISIVLDSTKTKGMKMEVKNGSVVLKKGSRIASEIISTKGEELQEKLIGKYFIKASEIELEP